MQKKTTVTALVLAGFFFVMKKTFLALIMSSCRRQKFYISRSMYTLIIGVLKQLEILKFVLTISEGFK